MGPFDSEVEAYDAWNKRVIAPPQMCEICDTPTKPAVLYFCGCTLQDEPFD